MRIVALWTCCFFSLPAFAEEHERVALDTLPGDVVDGIGDLFAWNQLPPAISIAGATGFASAFDDDVQEHFGPVDRLGTPGRVASHPAVLSGAIGTLVAASWLSEDERHRRMGYDLMRGLLVNNAATFAMKVAIRRERPDGGNFAFPSGHASNTFTVAAILGRHYGWKVGIPLHAFAGFVSLARLDHDSHWVSDSVAGAGIGLLVGHTIASGRSLPSPSSRLSWTPVIGTSIVAVQFSLDLAPEP